jgi:hypothetical protein
MKMSALALISLVRLAAAGRAAAIAAALSG